VERLGTVNFPVSCAPASQAAFNRGVALVHSFWYEEGEKQFSAIVQQDPHCAMAHWGLVMSSFHQIWDRPDASNLSAGWAQLQQVQTLAAQHPAATERERQYIGALSEFYRPGKADYEVRIKAYSSAMAALHARYPEDVDAAAFYGLSLLAATAPDDLSLTNNRAALALLLPLFVQYPDHPGVEHYIIHASDTPALARQGLPAAERYETVAASVPHGVHMPGHIYARLGMWQPDIRANRASVADSQQAERQHEGGVYDQLHADDFLLYAYIQSGDDASAQALLAGNTALIDHLGEMAGMHGGGMAGMLPFYRVEFPAMYALEMRDWPAALALKAPAQTPATDQLLVYWAHGIAAGHLRQPQEARASRAAYERMVAEVRKSPEAYLADSPSTDIAQKEIEAWAAFAEGKQEDALRKMGAAADEQDKVGQGEVDIPAREMLADMLLEMGQPQAALAEYEAALALSPGRVNGLYHAGMAAEGAGKPALAARYYSELLKNTENGSHSARPELVHAKSFVASQHGESQAE
jgi:tetratricopeptide (TPR) repeat protein